MAAGRNSRPARPRRSSLRPSDLAPDARSARGQIDRLAVLNEIARAATLDLELQPTLQRITDSITHHFGWESVACVMVEKERMEFVCLAQTTSIETAATMGVPVPFGTGIVGEVAQKGRAVVLRDVRRSKRYVSWSPDVRSELCVPIRHRGQVVAVLNIESTRVGAFDEQKELFETIAEQLSGVITNARLFEQVRARAAQLEVIGEISRLALDAGELSVLLDRVVNYVNEKFGLLASAILLLDESGERFEIAARAGDGSGGERPGEAFPLVGLLGRAMRGGSPLLIDDAQLDSGHVMHNPGVAAELVVPFRFRDRVLGALSLEGADTHVFNEDNVMFFQSLANQIAGGIHMARVNRRLIDTNRLVEERTREVELVNQQLQFANQVLHQLSTHDGLTGVANRRQFDELLIQEWRRGARVEAPIALVMADIDLFKSFNDTYGHQAGDDTLKEVAYALQDSVQRAGDVIARYGGEEFAIILPGMSLEDAARLADVMREAVEARKVRHSRSDVSRYVTVSLGVASILPSRQRSPAELVAAADRALYAAKRGGRNRIAVEVDREADSAMQFVDEERPS